MARASQTAQKTRGQEGLITTEDTEDAANTKNTEKSMKPRRVTRNTKALGDAFLRVPLCPLWLRFSWALPLIVLSSTIACGKGNPVSAVTPSTAAAAAVAKSEAASAAAVGASRYRSAPANRRQTCFRIYAGSHRLRSALHGKREPQKAGALHPSIISKATRSRTMLSPLTRWRANSPSAISSRNFPARKMASSSSWATTTPTIPCATSDTSAPTMADRPLRSCWNLPTSYGLPRAKPATATASGWSGPMARKL